MPKIKVRAALGRRVIFPLSVLAAPGRKPRALEGSAVVEVDDCRFVRRRIKVGDLVAVGDGETKPTRQTVTTKSEG